MRPPLIAELSGLDRRWALINRKAGISPDPKQVRVGLELKLALLSLAQSYPRAQQVAAGLVDLARSAPEVSKLATDQLDALRMASPRTALRVAASAAIRSLATGEPFPKPADETGQSSPAVFIVAADESQRAQAERLVQALTRGGLDAQGVDVLGAGQEARWQAPEGLEIRFWQGEQEAPFQQKLAQVVEEAAGQAPKLVGVSPAAGVEPGTYEVWLPKR